MSIFVNDYYKDIMKKILLIAFTFHFLNVSAQQAEEILFEKTTHDFGELKEVDGFAEYEFKFINNSNDSITIIKVKASCGCTTPGWTREVVPPGQAGFVKARYNSKNRPGTFNKSLTVTTNHASEKTKRLFIKGKVIPKAKSVLEEYPIAMGGLQVKYQSFNLGKVMLVDEPTVKTYEVYNASDSTITFLENVDKPKYINVSFDPQSIPTKSVGKITISYVGSQRNDYGFVSDNVVIRTDELIDTEKSFSVFATLQEYFPPMSAEQLAQAPQLKIENDMHDFGKVNQGDKRTALFTLTNTGQSNIEIRKAKSTCGCVTAKLKKQIIKPGKSIELELIFDTTDRRGIQQKSVSIYTNDPKKPAQRVHVRASIQSN